MGFVLTSAVARAWANAHERPLAPGRRLTTDDARPRERTRALRPRCVESVGSEPRDPAARRWTAPCTDELWGLRGALPAEATASRPRQSMSPKRVTSSVLSSCGFVQWTM